MTVGLATNLLLSHTRLDRVSRVSVSEYFWFCEARTSLEPEVYGSPIGVGDDGATWDGDGGAAWVEDGGAAWVEDGINSLLSQTRLDRVSRVSVSECLCFCGALRIAMLARNDRVIGPRWFYMLFNVRV